MSKRANKRQETKEVQQRPGLTQEEIEELQEAFNLFDTDETGMIDSGELKAAMDSLGYSKKNKIVYQMIEDMPQESIDFEGFLDLMTARISVTDSREDVLKVFRLFDEDESGYITVQNLGRIARELGEAISQQELQEMVDRADNDGDGKISADEFYNIMTKKSYD